MLNYKKNSNDVKYRIVDLRMANVDEGNEEYTAFEYGDQQIQYEDMCVLEILDADGRKRVVQHEVRKGLRFKIDGNQMKISDKIPLARLWLRDKHNEKMWYKIPYMLPVRDGYYELVIPSGAKEVELCADQYFLAAYSLSQDS